VRGNEKDERANLRFQFIGTPTLFSCFPALERDLASPAAGHEVRMDASDAITYRTRSASFSSLSSAWSFLMAFSLRVFSIRSSKDDLTPVGRCVRLQKGERVRRHVRGGHEHGC
jgi:hypothetical protein